MLVDGVPPPRSHDHDDPGAGEPARATRVSGRTRGNKLVHLAGDPQLVGRLVTVRIDHAGPYALRGTFVASE